MKKLNKYVSLFFFILLSLCLFGIYCSAVERYQWGDFEYSIENGKATVTGVLHQLEGDVAVPDKIEGFTVCAIGEKAFANANEITSVVLPEGITSIGNEAFYGCSGLKNINLGKTEKLGYSIFSGCTDLKEISVPSTVCYAETDSAHKGAFSGSSIEKVSFKKGTTQVTDYLLAGCVSVKEVILPEGVISIGKRAFESCSALGTINFPSTLNVIEDETFICCSSLSEVNLPQSLNSIGNEAFKNCEALLNVNLAQVVTMGYGVFENCNSLYEITVPKTLQTASVSGDGVGVFSLSGIKRIVFQNGITVVPACICSGCEKLSEVVFADSVTVIDKNAFSGCRSLSELTFPNKLTVIEDSSFKNCSGLKNVYLPGSAEQIKDGAFMNCTSLCEIDLGKIKKLGVNVFYNCNKLLHITVPETLSYVKNTVDGYGPFSGSGVEKAVFSGGITKIPAYIFSKCNYLKSVEIPHSVSVIGEGAFGGCSKLSRIYYTADKGQWNKIIKQERNEYILSSEIVFNYDNSGCVHSYTKYIPDNNATYSSDGTKTAHCDKNCGRTKTVKDNGSKLILGVTSKIVVSQTDSAVTLKWNKVKDADGYRIYIRNTAEGKWKVLSTKEGVNSFTVKNLLSGTKYTFAVKAYVDEGRIIWSPKYMKVHTATKPVTVTKINHSVATDSIKLTWNKVSCTFYRVFRFDYEKRKWITVKETVKGNSATVINLRSGTEYTFAVRPYVVTEDNRIIRSDSYKKIIVYTLLANMKFNIRRYTADSTEISWSSLKGADGYQVWYCVQGDKEYKKLGNFKGNKARHVKLKKGKTYIYKVRAYKKVSSGYIYSKFTDIKQIKIK